MDTGAEQLPSRHEPDWRHPEKAKQPRAAMPKTDVVASDLRDMSFLTKMMLALAGNKVSFPVLSAMKCRLHCEASYNIAESFERTEIWRQSERPISLLSLTQIFVICRNRECL